MEIFDISFEYELEQIRGTASVEVKTDDDEVLYVVRGITFFNTDEELEEAGLVREEELVIRRMGTETDALDWVEADTEEESELVTIIGAAIDKLEM